MSDLPPPPDDRPTPPPPPADLRPPSGYAGYEPGMAAGASGLQQVASQAKVSIIAVGLTGVLGLIGAIVQYGALDKAEQFLRGEISDDEFTDAVALSSLVSGVASVAQIVAVVFTCIWLSRVLGNHRKIARQTTWSSGWGAGGWFLPPFLFVIPLLAIREAWQASSPDVPAGDQRWKQAATAPIVWIWWVLFGVVPLAFIPITISRFGSFSTEAEDVAELVDDTATLSLVSACVSLAAAIAWIMMARQLTARHERLIGATR